MRSLRHLHLRGAIAPELRTVQWESRDHLVVPVVAMVEGVVWPVNAPKPELVLATELAVAPQQWNGRPCFAGHPMISGQPVTGNIPQVLETSFGRIFNAASPDQILTTKRLSAEAWFDLSRADELGERALSVLDRIRAYCAGTGPMVEVSVGAYLDPEPTEGEYHGLPYFAVWRSIISDHLAFLDEGDEGACSVAAGCGAARTALRHSISLSGITMEAPKEEQENEDMSLRSSLKDRLRSMAKAVFTNAAGDDGTTARELGIKLDSALRAVVPGFLWVEDILLEKGQVVYCTDTGEYQTYRQGYTLADDGSVTLAKDAEEVEVVSSYQPVTAQAATQPTVAHATPPAGCGCGNHAVSAASAAAPSPSTQETRPMKENVKSLIEGSGGKFTDADAGWLDQVPDDRLALLGAPAAAASTTTVSAAAALPPQTASVAPRAMTEAEFMAAAPESLKTLLTSAQKVDADKRTSLVHRLKTAQSEYTEAELHAMSTDGLDRLSRACGVAVDYSGQGHLPRLNVTQNESIINPPNGYQMALAEKRGQASAQ